jgi:high-affinity iron transporter
MNAAFVEALTIVLREGLEAILVLAALAAYLARADANDRLNALWLGAAAALLASIAAAWVFEQFFNGVHNDLFEGITILLTAALMFYVSGWLLIKQDPKAWQHYMNRQADQALSAQSTYLVGALAFFAVMREGGESVLFLHVLAKTSGGWTAALISGVVSAFVLLAAFFLIIVNTSRRLPLRAVFLVTSLFLFVMGLKFVGEGLQEFQEQALISYDEAPGATWLSAIGFNPTWQALGAQLVILLVASLSLVVASRTNK